MLFRACVRVGVLGSHAGYTRLQLDEVKQKGLWVCLAPGEIPRRIGRTKGNILADRRGRSGCTLCSGDHKLNNHHKCGTVKMHLDLGRCP